MQLFTNFIKVFSPLSPHIQFLCLTDASAFVYADVSNTQDFQVKSMKCMCLLIEALKVQYTSKSKIYFFLLAVLLSIHLDCYGVNLHVVELSVVEMPAFSEI